MEKQTPEKKELLSRINQLEAENERLNQKVLKYESANTNILSENDRIELMQSLLNVAKKIPAHTSFPEAAKFIFDELKNILHIDAGYIALLNKETRMNEVVYLEPGSQVCTVDLNLPMPIRGFRATVYKSKEVKYHNDFQNSKWNKLMPAGHTMLKNVLFVPMLINNEAIGLIGLSNKPGGFTDKDAEMAKEFGVLAVIALNYSKSIEEKEKAENILRENEERFRLMTEDSPVMLWESGLDAKCNYFNKQWLNFTGKEMHEEVGDGWIKGVHPKDVDFCINTYLKAFDKREKFKMEYRLKNAEGEYRWILDIGIPKYNEAGIFEGYSGSCIDITERRQLEQIQKESTEFYYALFEKNKAIKLLINPLTGIIEDANTAASNFYGYSLEEMKRMNINEINQLSDKEINAEMQRALKEERRFFEFKHKLASGEIKDVSVYSGPVNFKGKELLYSIIYDITEQKKAKLEIIKSEEKYRNLYEKTPVMLHSIDNEGRLLSVSDFWLTKLGYSRQEVIGRKSLEFLTAESQKLFFEYFPSFKEKGEIFNMPYQMIKKNGELIDVLLSAIAEKNADGSLKRTLAVIIDVTEQKRAKIDLAKLERKSNVWLENSPVCTKILDIDFNLQFMSQSGINELQIEDINEFYGKPYPFHFYPDSFKIPMNENLRKAKETGKTITQEAFVNDIKGNKLWYHSTIVPVYDINNKLDYIMVVSLETTKRKEAELELINQNKEYEILNKKLISSEEKFRLIVNALPQFISYCSVDFKYLYVNKSYEKEFGIKQKDIENQKIIDIIGENAFEQAKVHMQKVIEGENVRYYEKLEYKNGSVKHIDGQLIPHLDENNQVKGYFAVLTDISTYMEARELLEKSEKEKSIVLESMSEMLTYCDKDLNIIWANKASIVQRNLNTNDVNGKKCYEAFQNKDKPCKKCPVVLSLETKKPEELEITTHDNKIFKLRAYPVLNSVNEIIGVVEYAVDITVQKMKDEELKRSYNLYRTLASNLPGISIFLFDDEKRIIIAEGSEFKKRIYLKADYEGRIVTDLKLDNEVLNYLDRLYTSALNGEHVRDELYYNNWWYQHIAVPIKSHGNKVLGGIVVAQNITDQKIAEIELEESKEKIRDLSNHLQFLIEQERTRISREIHDELGQNLTYVKLNLALIFKNLKNEIDNKGTLQFKNMYDVLDKTIKKVKKISSDLRPGLIDELGLIPAIEWHLSEFQKQTDIVCHFKFNMELTSLNKELSINIFRIIQESLTNILKHAKASEVEIEINFTKDKLILVINDNGEGIKPSELRKKQSFGITGMRERVELFNGKFKIKGHPGKGTSIQVEIPYK